MSGFISAVQTVGRSVHPMQHAKPIICVSSNHLSVSTRLVYSHGPLVQPSR